MAAHNAPPSPPLSPSPSSPFPSAPFILPVMPSSPSPSFSSSPPPSPCLDSEGADMFLGLDDDVLAAEEWGEKKDSFEEVSFFVLFCFVLFCFFCFRLISSFLCFFYLSC